MRRKTPSRSLAGESRNRTVIQKKLVVTRIQTMPKGFWWIGLTATLYKVLPFLLLLTPKSTIGPEDGKSIDKTDKKVHYEDSSRQ